MKIAVMYPGAGGIPFGMTKNEGVRMGCYYEPDRETKFAMCRNFPDATEFDTLSNFIEYGVKNDDITVLAARLRKDNWQHVRRVMQGRRFQFVVIEGMAVLRSKGLVPILQDFWALGYNVEWHVVPASAFGSDYRGERLWIVAHPIPTGRKKNREFAETEGVLGFKYLTNDVLDEFRARTERLRPKARGSVPDKPRVLRRNDRLSRKVDSARVRLLSDDASPLIAEFIAWALVRGKEKGNRKIYKKEIQSEHGVSNVQKRRNIAVNQRMLETKNIEFSTKNNGVHLVIPNRKGTIDYWPTTDKWRVRGQKETQSGVEKLLAYIRKS